MGNHLNGEVITKPLRCFADIVGMAHPYDILIRNVLACSLRRLLLSLSCHTRSFYSFHLPPLIHEITASVADAEDWYAKVKYSPCHNAGKSYHKRVWSACEDYALIACRFYFFKRSFKAFYLCINVVISLNVLQDKLIVLSAKVKHQYLLM